MEKEAFIRDKQKDFNLVGYTAGVHVLELKLRQQGVMSIGAKQIKNKDKLSICCNFFGYIFH